MRIDITSSIIIFLFTILPKLIDLTLKVYKCTNLGDPDKEAMFLESDYEVVCWSSEHVRFILIVALPSFLIWCFLLPIKAIHYLHANKDEIHKPEYMNAYAFLIRGYHKDALETEFVNFYRKLILILLAIYGYFSGRF